MDLRTFIHRVLDAQRGKNTKELSSTDRPLSVKQTGLAASKLKMSGFDGMNKLGDENIWIGGCVLCGFCFYLGL